MKKLILLLFVLGMWMGAAAQYDNSIALFIASEEAWGAGNDGFQGNIRMAKQHGSEVAGTFTVKGDKFLIRAGNTEWYGDGEFVWELQHRAKRIKRRFYDPYNVPAMVFAFRFYRMDLMNENVGLSGTPPQVNIDVEFGSSVVQGSHRLLINPKTLAIEKVWVQVFQDDFLEMAEIGNLQKDNATADAVFTLDEAAWQQKGYSILNLAKAGSEALPLDEQVLVR
ncbi:MAG TPA: hypothetical protein ENJ82_17785 [Bacteroidetes bacterium]|nr:hypothetical protein [Bacteroidota bacterium]